jgi:pyruvate kinase
MAAMFMATHVSVQGIVALTESGSTAKWLSRVRSSVPIFALSPLAASRRRMALYRNVYPVAQAFANVDDALSEGVQLLVQQGYIKSGDRIILTMGDNTGTEGGTNTMRLVQVGEGGYSEIQPSPDIE